jgi:hypothetical protein
VTPVVQLQTAITLIAITAATDAMTAILAII